MLICCFWFQTTKAIQLKDELVEVNGVNVKVNIDFFLFIFYLSPQISHVSAFDNNIRASNSNFFIRGCV